ncbi:calcium/sodium antiporter [Halobaculum sp. CBA1158]|uniref:calcium/sodium antiporter n=1 Tax=Halobaculum sp. CBA1158 TaxID=2904243 RepID=UPI001F440D86|nr:calcium/sodium antiporter [Halobaculum sp. CBA1158]UIP00212.1 calcium/sodium antiporter [Halobaculum sp. CBA1158]
MLLQLADVLLTEHGLFLLLGVVFLYLGAEALVRGAAGLALGVGIHAALVGVTVVAFATTAPELFIGVIAGVDGDAQLGLGAVIGSNIANIGLVLGVSALLRPLSVSRNVVRRHLPFMALAALLVVVFGLDGTIGRIEGGVFLLVLAAFTVVLYRGATDAAEAVDESGAVADGGAVVEEVPEVDADAGVQPRHVAFLVVGLALLFFGSRWLIDSGRSMLYQLGFTQRLIGLTVLAFGTSLPEFAASVVAAVRGEADFSVGNVVGSNIYNVLAVLGLLAIIAPVFVSSGVSSFDFPALIAFTAAAAVVMLRGGEVGRLDGTVLLGGYLVFFYLLLP